MSLHTAAQHLASKGRGGDTELVHMTRGEIKGLQELALAHGGSLSINPDTGLVEANFLKRLLPMIAGAALAATGIGAPAAALMVGGFEGIRTGDIGKGLMAGLGAYGGAGLASGLSSAGAASVADTGGTAAVNQLGSQATNLTANQLPNLGAEQLQGLQSVSNSGMYNAADVLKTANAANTSAGAQNLINAQTFPNLNAAQLQGLRDTASSGVYNPADIVRTAGAQNATAGASYNPFVSGIRNIVDNPLQGGKDTYKALPKGTLSTLGLGVSSAMTPEAPGAAPEAEPDEYDKRLAAYRLSPNFSGFVPRQPKPYYRPTGLGYSGYAEGGNVMEASRGTYDDEPMSDVGRMAAGGIAAYSNRGQVRHLSESVGVPRTGIFRDTDSDTARKDALEAALIRNKKLARAANIKLAPMPKTSVKGLGDVEEVAAGGSIGGYSDGGRMLRGPGDGMSDSIPATIGKRQPARLADGEFVVPADVVSHIGNGSTDAGAKRLYSMMDKVRKARTGKKAQAKAIKADKYMPA